MLVFLSRHAALKKYSGEKVQRDLESQGTFVKAATPRVLSEEAPGAYKDIHSVDTVSHDLGIATLAVRLKPHGVTKG